MPQKANTDTKHIRLALELKPSRYKSAADAVENGGGDGLRLISYVGGIAMCNKSAIAAMTPPMLSAALADNVSTTDTCHKHTYTYYVTSRLLYVTISTMDINLIELFSHTHTYSCSSAT